MQMVHRMVVAGVLATMCVAMSGCATTLSCSPIGRAEQLEEPSGVSYLSRDGGVYFGGQPTRDGLRAMGELGVKMVINLRPDVEMEDRVAFDEPALVGELGMRYETIPVAGPSLGVAEAERLAEILGETSGPVLLHCGSSNRVGGLWALYLNRSRGYEPDDAIALGRAAGLRSDHLEEVVRAAMK
jgi:uncharacterized protein (TIGR01244 family)